MNVIQALTELYDSQSTDSIYRELAGKILQNLSEMKRVTIYDIADLTASSRTTIWRLVQKLGYGSFSDFRYALQSAASQYVYYNRMLGLQSANTPKGIMDEVGRQLLHSKKLYNHYLSADLCEALLKELHTAKKIYFYIPFRTSFISSFQQNLWKDGKETCYEVLIPNMIETSAHLDEHSIVFINTIEFTETLEMTEVFEKIKEKKATIWLFASRESQYGRYADRHLLAVDANATSWIIAFECYLLTLSECYRASFID